ncbi:MAG: hypothetical protein K2Q18_00355 [Bdellovibrionales bacterium]|nr:hypothetical protein [Bdellovibrionales bacterium]
MKVWLISIFICANSAFCSEAKTILTCDQLIDSNVNSKAKNTMLSAGSVKILKDSNQYNTAYDIDLLKFKERGSILSLNTGCGEKLEFAGPCEETDEAILMEKSFNDEKNTVIKGIFNKKNLQLEIIHETGHETNKIVISDVILGCH